MSMHPHRNLFKEFANPVYVETGAYLGDSIQLALDAGFQEIHSIEISEQHVEHCRKRFEGKPVTIHHSDSAVMLWDVIKDIKEPITFWLDSHSQLLEDEPPLAHPFPLMGELAQIQIHKIKSHTIIIDDFLFMSHPDITKRSRAEIISYLKNINPDYKLDWFANPIVNNILVAHP